ncbi:MAG: hypothetical protein KKE73_02675, partial [Proteobacteria bacterium]|nr:hypothetical protein [Pseudomonadota bacterium]
FLVVMTFSCVEVPVKFCNSNRTPAKDGMTTFTFVANCQVITISLHPEGFTKFLKLCKLLPIQLLRNLRRDFTDIPRRAPQPAVSILDSWQVAAMRCHTRGMTTSVN